MLRRNVRSIFRSFLLACTSLFAFRAPAQKTDQPEWASFHVNNVFTVKIPQGAHSVRVWFAVPQEDAFSTITNFKAVSESPVHFDWDSWGNKVGYIEVLDPSVPRATITGGVRFEAYRDAQPRRSQGDPPTD
jgi:hypothetical protein